MIRLKMIMDVFLRKRGVVDDRGSKGDGAATIMSFSQVASHSEDPPFIRARKEEIAQHKDHAVVLELLGDSTSSDRQGYT